MAGKARILASVALALGVCACSQLPSSGPSTKDIVKLTDSASSFSYALFDVTRAVSEKLVGRYDDTFAGRFPQKRGGASEAIGVGDSIAVTIWEASEGGLFSAGFNQVSGAKSATIPPQPVGQDGTISVPYAGVIRVAGSTPTQVKGIIEAALAGKAIEPQVLITVTQNVSNTVTVTGEVVRGGLVPLTARGGRILDVIAAVGGSAGPPHETFVQLSRGGRTVSVPLQTVVDNPSENIYLQPGDTLVLVRQPQTFTAFGATGESARVDFDARGIYLDEAIAKVGGLLDSQADPAGVFIFRFERREIVAAIDPENVLLKKEGDVIPVVYRVNLRDPSGLFVAKAFRVYDRDLVYVTNAPLNELQKFIQLLNAFLQPAQSGLSLRNSVIRN